MVGQGYKVKPANTPPPVSSNASWAEGNWLIDQLDGLTAPNTATAQSSKQYYYGRPGVYPGAKDLGITEAMSKSTINGLSIRMEWDKIELTEGNYDFSVFQTIRDDFPNEKFSVRFMAGRHTPSWHKGYVINHNGFQYPKPWNPNVRGDHINQTFLDGWGAFVAAFANWCKNNRVRLVHLSQYGWDWAELFYGVELQNAWKADFGSGESTASGSVCANTVINAHKELLDLARPVLPPYTMFELPASGFSSSVIAGPIFRYATELFAQDTLAVQSNCWGATTAAQGFGCGRASPSGSLYQIHAGFQAFAVGGPTNTLYSNQNGASWNLAYNGGTGINHSVSQNRMLYTEIYRETFEDNTDRAALYNVIDNFTFDPSPAVTD